MALIFAVELAIKDHKLILISLTILFEIEFLTKSTLDRAVTAEINLSASYQNHTPWESGFEFMRDGQKTCKSSIRTP